MLEILDYSRGRFGALKFHLMKVRTDSDMLMWDGEDRDSKMDGWTRVKDGDKNIGIYDYPYFNNEITLWTPNGDQVTIDPSKIEKPREVLFNKFKGRKVA